jgi:hypothetical protein
MAVEGVLDDSDEEVDGLCTREGASRVVSMAVS